MATSANFRPSSRGQGEDVAFLSVAEEPEHSHAEYPESIEPTAWGEEETMESSLPEEDSGRDEELLANNTSNSSEENSSFENWPSPSEYTEDPWLQDDEFFLPFVEDFPAPKVPEQSWQVAPESTQNIPEQHIIDQEDPNLSRPTEPESSSPLDHEPTQDLVEPHLPSSIEPEDSSHSPVHPEPTQDHAERDPPTPEDSSLDDLVPSEALFEPDPPRPTDPASPLEIDSWEESTAFSEPESNSKNTTVSILEFQPQQLHVVGSTNPFQPAGRSKPLDDAIGQTAMIYLFAIGFLVLLLIISLLRSRPHGEQEDEEAQQTREERQLEVIMANIRLAIYQGTGQLAEVFEGLGLQNQQDDSLLAYFETSALQDMSQSEYTKALQQILYLKTEQLEQYTAVERSFHNRERAPPIHLSRLTFQSQALIPVRSTRPRVVRLPPTKALRIYYRFGSKGDLTDQEQERLLTQGQFSHYYPQGSLVPNYVFKQRRELLKTIDYFLNRIRRFFWLPTIDLDFVFFDLQACLEHLDYAKNQEIVVFGSHGLLTKPLPSRLDLV